MELGARFFDIRLCNYTPNEFNDLLQDEYYLCHGGIVTETFKGGFLEPVQRFLSTHPQEVVFALLKNELGEIN